MNEYEREIELYAIDSPLKSGHSEESIYLLKEVYLWQGSMIVNLNWSRSA